MERYIGVDVHSADCMLALIPEEDRNLREIPVETNS